MTVDQQFKGSIQQLVEAWYQALDVHEPLVGVLPYLDGDGLSMTFPEGELHGLDEFAVWYEGVIRIFFDEVHTVEGVEVGEPVDELYPVTVVVRWQASRWLPPNPNSERLDMNAYQTWSVRFLGDTPVITSYVVDELRPNPGSVAL